MAESNQKPEIRFAGFTDPWEQRKLGDLAKRTYGGGTPNTSKPEYWGGNIPWIQSSNLTECSFSAKICKSISPIGLANSATQIVPEKSIAVVTHVGVGKLSIMLDRYCTSQDFISLSELQGDLYFCALVCQKKLLEDLDIVQGSAIKGITKDDLLNKQISVPSVIEQSQIGKLFSNLDNLITLHQCEYDKTVNIKKAMLDKMFPKNGEYKPEIRFAGFTDAWEQRKLGELFEENNERNDDKYPVEYTISISSMHFNPAGNGADESSLSSYKVLRVGDIAFEGHTSKDFSYGRFVMNDIGDGIMSPRFTSLRPKFTLVVDFWKHYIHYEPIMKYILVQSTKSGTMMNELVVSDLCAKSILIPGETEQSQIGKLFANLDDLITLHQRELRKLQNIKKALLEKMFV